MDELILNEIKKMSKLLALNLVKEMKSIDQYKCLNDVDYQPKEIAELLNTTNNTVSVALSKLKKIKKK